MKLAVLLLSAAVLLLLLIKTADGCVPHELEDKFWKKVDKIETALDKYRGQRYRSRSRHRQQQRRHYQQQGSGSRDTGTVLGEDGKEHQYRHHNNK